MTYGEDVALFADFKKINGVEYLFKNHVKCDTTITFQRNKNFHLKNKVVFWGMDKDIEIEINKSDFEKKIDFDKIEAFRIDSVSFSVNENKDKIDLIYYLDLGNKRKTVTIGLEKDNETWNLN
ncbi:hypothetical protein LH29_13385 [Draconibacterium sediminis]|uniref:Uncharacterized protein n=1 Tax=Draconibacterium sediminis TaxID=1544798 RepID=A0A0D8JBS9_9BACT|nr:hypothetical protein LH29_13385 [Draconibacterium sediminis]